MVSHQKKILPQKSGKHNIVKMEKINKQMSPFRGDCNTVNSACSCPTRSPFLRLTLTSLAFVWAQILLQQSIGKAFTPPFSTSSSSCFKATCACSGACPGWRPWAICPRQRCPHSRWHRAARAHLLSPLQEWKQPPKTFTATLKIHIEYSKIFTEQYSLLKPPLNHTLCNK